MRAGRPGGTSWIKLILIAGVVGVSLVRPPVGGAVVDARATMSADTGWLSPVPLQVQKDVNVSGFPQTRTECFPINGSGCAVETPYGVFNNGTVRLSGTSSFVPVIPAGLLAVPDSNVVINLWGGVDGSFVSIYRNFRKATQPTRQPDGTLAYELMASADVTLRDTNGAMLQARYDSISFSPNGKWMVFDSPYVSKVRVNLETFEVFKFGLPTDYGIGLDPGYRTAITDDGRFVSVNEAFGSNGIDVIDLTNCVPPPPNTTFRNYLVTGYSCQSRSLVDALRAAVPGYTLARPREFLTNQTLILYAAYTDSAGNRKAARYFVTAGDIAPAPLEYLALGDSFSSGEGAFNYRAGTDNFPENLCHQSRDSYPYLLAQASGKTAFASVACSGARLMHITDVPQYPVSPDQALAFFTPGGLAQLQFVKFYRPEAVTVGITGNDIEFSKIVRQCVWKTGVLGSGTCYSTYAERLGLVRTIRREFAPLADLLRQLKNVNAPNGRRVYAIGYPSVVLPSGGNCDLNVRLNAEERIFATELVTDLNTVIRAAAKSAGVYYVDVEDALNGHRLCETKSSEMAVNGVTRGDDLPTGLPFLGNESYHPNRLGQSLLAAKIAAVTSNLTASMPGEDASAAPPAETSFTLLSGYSGSAPITPTYSVLGPMATYPQATYPINLQSSTYALEPSSTYNLSIHSDPVSLGSVTTDVAGNINTAVTIPGGVGPGWHELHLTGPDPTGNTVDLAQPLYVGASATDMDANGIPDATQACVYVPASGVDADRDDIDDACDGYIADTPTKAQATLAFVAADLTQTYDGSVKAVEVTTNPSGLGGVSVSYSQNGNEVASPTDAGTYKADASLDNPNYEATAITDTLVIERASQSVTVASSAPGSKAYGSSFTVAATASSGLPVTYASSGACTNNGATFTITDGAGTCTVTYDQAGNGNYKPAAQMTETVTATKAQATLAFVIADLAQTYDGSGKTVGVTTSPSGLSGVTVSYSQSGNAVANPRNAGSYKVEAALDNSNYEASAITDTLVIARASQIITVGTSAPAGRPYGAGFTVAAMASSGLPVAYGSNGSCSNVGPVFTITSGSGTCTVTYDQAGDGNHEPADRVSETVTATKAQATLTFVPADLAQTYDGAGKSVGVTATPSGLSGVSVSYSQSGNAVVGPTNAGSYKVDASLDNPNYEATAITDTLVIERASQTINVTSSPPSSKAYAGSFTVAASASSGLPVAYGSSGSCSNTGVSFTITSGIGTCTVTYDQAGSSNYRPAAQVTEALNATKAPLTVKAEDKAMTYADPVPALTYGITGFANGETLSSSGVTGTPALATTATSSSPAGSYPITVDVGTLSSSNYGFVLANGTLTVANRQARVIYTGTNYLAIPAAGTATINLAAKVSRGGSLGNLALARVEFTVKKYSGVVQTTVYALADGNGNAATTASVPTSDDPYTVEVRTDPTNTYWTSGVDVGSLQVIVGSGTGRTAGGGWIPDPTNDVNGKSNFGFTVQNSKNGIKGNSLFIYRARVGSDEIQYIVKSNSWQGGGLTFNVNRDPTRATFTGKATVQRYVNGVFDAAFNSGGYTFTVDDLDGDLKSPRVSDGYAVAVLNSGNQIVKQLGTRSAPVALGGGNVLIQSG